MSDETKILKKVLVDESYISEKEVNQAEQEAEKQGVSLSDYLVAQDILGKDLLGQAIAEWLKIPYADMNSHQPTKEQVLKIPESVARRYRAVLFSFSDTKVVIATDDPEQKDIKEVMSKVFPSRKVVIHYSLPDDIDLAFVHYRKSLDTRFSKIIKERTRIAPEILEEIFEDAITYNASDIHFEPQGKDILVRFRVDGLLQEAGRIPSEYYENILNRVKVQSRLRIDEHYTTQDGSLRYEKKGTSIDMRTSVVPTVEGEKIVLRVLASYVQSLSLSDLGLSSNDQAILQEMSEKPFGMLLVTGPTGSGKTTTLYALLRLLNKPDVNITTIEDPVEYKTRGINQIQVNTEANLTFMSGLRSIVRQDPDIILVGEIRDTETAEISVNAALTGHLLLSTFHANDAATAMPRLLEMGIEPFLLASTLQVVIAQRLVRKICEQCRYSIKVHAKDLIGKEHAAAHLLGHSPITLYKGKGCVACGGTGFKGRTAIFEIVVVTQGIQDLILAHSSSQELWKEARAGGAKSMFEDGVEKVLSGITTLDELVRVVEPPKKGRHLSTNNKHAEHTEN